MLRCRLDQAAAAALCLLGACSPALLQATAVTALPDSPTAFWCSWAGPNRTLTLGASDIPTTAPVSVTALPSGRSAIVTPGPDVQVTASALKVVVPPQLPHGAYSVSVPGMAAPFICGAPDIYWVQGAGGNHTVAGGWLRAFGRNLALPEPGATLSERRRAIRAGELSTELQRATQHGAWAEVARLATAVSALAAERPRTRPSTTVTLCPAAAMEANVACTTLRADADAVSQWSAKWWLPASMLPGDYTVKVDNGFVSAALDSFISQSEPHVSTVTVKSPREVAWPTKVFAVPEEKGGLFEGTMNFTATATGPSPNGHGDDCNFGGYPYVCPRDATEAVLGAIAAAGVAGGGIVQLPAGRWYLNAALILPDNVLIKGAGMGQTGIFFSFQNATSAPPVMVGSDCNEPGPGGANATLKPDSRYGVEDLSIWIIANHNTIFSIPPCSSGVRVRRVRVRANPFTGAVGWSDGNSTPGFGKNGRWTEWTQFRAPTPAPGGPLHSFVGLFDIQGGKNFEIADNDLYSTWVTFRCWAFGSSWGLIANVRDLSIRCLLSQLVSEGVRCFVCTEHDMEWGSSALV
jgi:hypothetical protein